VSGFGLCGYQFFNLTHLILDSRQFATSYYTRLSVKIPLRLRRFNFWSVSLFQDRVLLMHFFSRRAGRAVATRGKKEQISILSGKGNCIIFEGWY